MPLTVGYIHVGGDLSDPQTVYVRIFYNSTFVPTGAQTYLDAPLIDNANAAFGPTGFCLLVVNKTGAPQVATVFNSAGTVLIDHVTVPRGDVVTGVVTTGQARSRTAAQMAALGLSRRGDVGTVLFE